MQIACHLTLLLCRSSSLGLTLDPQLIRDLTVLITSSTVRPHFCTPARRPFEPLCPFPVVLSCFSSYVFAHVFLICCFSSSKPTPCIITAAVTAVSVFRESQLHLKATHMLAFTIHLICTAQPYQHSCCQTTVRSASILWRYTERKRIHAGCRHGFGGCEAASHQWLLHCGLPGRPRGRWPHQGLSWCRSHLSRPSNTTIVTLTHCSGVICLAYIACWYHTAHLY